MGRRETAPQGNKAISRLNSFVHCCELIDNYIRSFKCSSAIQVISRGTEQSREERNLCATTGVLSALHSNMWILKCSQHKGPQLKSKSWRNTSIGSMKHTNLILFIFICTHYFAKVIC